MENTEEIKIKSIRISLQFDTLFKKAIKKNFVNYNNEEEIQNFKNIIKSYLNEKSAVMWKTRKINSSDLENLNLSNINKKDLKYVTLIAYNPIKQIDINNSSAVEKFVYEEFLSTLEKLSNRIIRDEAKSQRFEIVEVQMNNPDIDYTKIGIIKNDSGYLPFGSNIISCLWLKK